MRSTLLLLASAVLLGGCATFLEGVAQAGVTFDPNRTYTDPQISLPTPVPSQQPTWSNQAGEQYQTIMVNTPNGMVYRRCKVLNGQAVACF